MCWNAKHQLDIGAEFSGTSCLLDQYVNPRRGR
jgi:hypothetical protein